VHRQQELSPAAVDAAAHLQQELSPAAVDAAAHLQQELSPAAADVAAHLQQGLSPAAADAAAHLQQGLSPAAVDAVAVLSQAVAVTAGAAGPLQRAAVHQGIQITTTAHREDKWHRAGLLSALIISPGAGKNNPAPFISLLSELIIQIHNLPSIVQYNFRIITHN